MDIEWSIQQFGVDQSAFDDGDICKIYDAWLEKTIGRRVVINIVFCLYEYVRITIGLEPATRDTLHEFGLVFVSPQLLLPP